MAGGSQGGAGETKTVPSVEYTVIKTVGIESEPVFGERTGLLQDSPGRTQSNGLVVAGGLSCAGMMRDGTK